jgi:hypothetical protein
MVKTSVKTLILRMNYDTISIFLRTLKNILRNRRNSDFIKKSKK